jgi:hypothetical protein
MKLYYSPKSGRIRWAFQVARMEERKVGYRVLVRNQMERDHLEDPGVDWRIILKWSSKK